MGTPRDDMKKSLSGPRPPLNPNDPSREDYQKMSQKINQANQKGDGLVSKGNKAKKNAAIADEGFANKAVSVPPEVSEKIVANPGKKDLIKGRFFNDTEQTNNAGKYTPTKNSHHTSMGTKPLGKLPGALGAILGAKDGARLQQELDTNRKRGKPVEESYADYLDGKPTTQYKPKDL